MPGVFGAVLQDPADRQPDRGDELGVVRADLDDQAIGSVSATSKSLQSVTIRDPLMRRSALPIRSVMA